MHRLLFSSPNMNQAKKSGKEFLRNAVSVIKNSSDEISANLAESNSLKDAVIKTIVKTSQISREDLQKTADSLGIPISNFTAEIVKQIEEQGCNSFANRVLSLSKKYNVDPNTVINVYLKNSVESGINNLTETREEIQETIVKEVVKNKVKKNVKKFSLTNYLKKIWQKLKEIFFTICNK